MFELITFALLQFASLSFGSDVPQNSSAPTTEQSSLDGDHGIGGWGDGHVADLDHGIGGWGDGH